jgi:hypothetical protein
VLRGEFDTGSPPDKRPKFNPETRVKKGKTPPALGGAKEERLYLGSTFLKMEVRILPRHAREKYEEITQQKERRLSRALQAHAAGHQHLEGGQGICIRCGAGNTHTTFHNAAFLRRMKHRTFAKTGSGQILAGNGLFWIQIRGLFCFSQRSPTLARFVAQLGGWQGAETPFCAIFTQTR